MMKRLKQETGLTFGSDVEASSHDGEIEQEAGLTCCSQVEACSHDGEIKQEAGLTFDSEVEANMINFLAVKQLISHDGEIITRDKRLTFGSEVKASYHDEEIEQEAGLTFDSGRGKQS